MSAGTVYVIRSGKYYKIGRTRNLARRLSVLQTSHPSPLTVIYQLEILDSSRLERFLHDQCFPFRAKGGGEWYQLTKAALQAIHAVHRWPDPSHVQVITTPTPRRLKAPRKTYECLRCYYRWTPYHGRRPRRCARCRSPYWDQPRTRPRLTGEA